MKKILVGSLAAFIVLPMLMYAAYDLSQFQLRRGEINTILDRAAEQDRRPPEQVRRMLEYYDLSGYAARLLARELNAFPERGSILGWNINSALWLSLVRLHLTREEQTTVYLALAPTGINRRGFTSTALALYRRQPADLTLPEVAAIMARIRAPSANEETVAKLRELLLERYASRVQRR